MKSMTGMGKAQGSVQDSVLRIEIKAVNHRFCESNIRLPARFGILEVLAQQLVKSLVARGKIDIFINEEKSTKVTPVEMDAFKAYYDYLNSIRSLLSLKEEVGLQNLLGGVGSWIQREVNAEQAWKELEVVLRSALVDLDKMRISEGLRLKEDMRMRFATIDGIRSKVGGFADKVAAELEQKLKDKIADKLKDISQLDPQRLQTEVVFYLDRMDISEELERLKSHLAQVKIFFDSKEAIGRKLDFLLQEINREFNTIASKSQSTEIAYLVVDAKAELEKIREQVQNIE